MAYVHLFFEFVGFLVTLTVFAAAALYFAGIVDFGSSVSVVRVRLTEEEYEEFKRTGQLPDEDRRAGRISEEEESK
jgi:hypothetical protein